MSFSTPPIVHLVACSKAKRAEPSPARELYAASDWFRKARAYVEGEGGPWFILSAAHGLVAPDQVLAPYEAQLPAGAAWRRRLWAARVAGQLQLRGLLWTRPTRFVFLAGALYREPLADFLGGPAATGAPLARLGLGEQKAWLAAHTRKVRR